MEQEATLGAQKSGFNITWGMDNDPNPSQTWKLYFPHATLYEEPADKFIANKTRNYRVDVLHISPPCQYVSGNNTKSSEARDNENMKTLRNSGKILDVAKPRIAVMEEVPGFLEESNKQVFGEVLSHFTQRGYAITWRTLQGTNSGLPALRKRFILLAAA